MSRSVDRLECFECLDEDLGSSDNPVVVVALIFFCEKTQKKAKTLLSFTTRQQRQKTRPKKEVYINLVVDRFVPVVEAFVQLLFH